MVILLVIARRRKRPEGASFDEAISCLSSICLNKGLLRRPFVRRSGLATTILYKSTNTHKRLQAPRKQVKKKSPHRERSELELLHAYRRSLVRHGTDARVFDLENEFYWLFRLSGILALAYRTFDEVNQKYFANSLPKPKIIYCSRSTGGYYNKTRHTIGISLAMTVEHGEKEFLETLLHEIAHIAVQSHSQEFYTILKMLGGSGRKAPSTILLKAKRERFLAEHYRVRVRCPQCKKEYCYRTRRALNYACRPCCDQFAGGKFDARFKFIEAPLPAGRGVGVRSVSSPSPFSLLGEGE